MNWIKHSTIKWFFTGLILYLVFRAVFISYLNNIKLVTDFSSSLHEKKYLVILLLISIVFYTISVITRLVQQTNTILSLKILKYCLLLFFYCLIEILIFDDFEFLSINIFYGKLTIPYPLFLFILSFELIFYFRGRFKKLENNESYFKISNPLFDESAEIKDKSVDYFERRAVQEITKQILSIRSKRTFSIGIIGEWGIGKTSFVNEILDCFKSNNDYIIIKFRPWNSTPENSILYSFIETLKNQLSIYDPTLRESFDNYFRALKVVESALNVSILDSINPLISDSSFLDEVSSINDSLDRINKKIIVFIDDLDRLSPDEILSVLALIRNTGGFNNSIYISCYDREYILSCLRQDNKAIRSDFLDKFFDFEFSVSPYSQEWLFDRLKNDPILPFHKRINNNDVIKELNSLSQNFFPFRNIRDLNRFINFLSMEYTLIGERAVFKDLFLFGILKFKYPNVAYELWNNSSKFFLNLSPLSNSSIVLAIRKNQATLYESELIYWLKINKSNKLEYLNEEDLELISNILTELFPETIDGVDIHPYSIRSNNAFEGYFYNITPSVYPFKDNIKEIILSGQYLDLPFFNGGYDLKKDMLIKNAISDDRTIVSDKKFALFLDYLIDWSEGRLEKYSFLEYIPFEPKSVKIADHIIIPSQDKKINILYRSILISNLIRGLEYEDDFKFFSDRFQKSDLIDFNHNLFDKYLRDIRLVDNNVLDALYSQIISIERDNSKIKLDVNSLRIFRRELEKDELALGYFDICVRPASYPNYDLKFVFEPFAIDIFESKDKFREFMESKVHVSERVPLLLSYLDKAKPSEYNPLEFRLEQAEFNSIPTEFINMKKQSNPI